MSLSPLLLLDLHAITIGNISVDWYILNLKQNNIILTSRLQ